MCKNKLAYDVLAKMRDIPSVNNDIKFIKYDNSFLSDEMLDTANIKLKSHYNMNEMIKIMKINCLFVAFCDLCETSNTPIDNNIKFVNIKNEWFIDLHPYIGTINAIGLAKPIYEAIYRYPYAIIDNDKFLCSYNELLGIKELNINVFDGNNIVKKSGYKTYLMHDHASLLYKIGRSNNPERRLREISGNRKRVMSLIDVCDIDIEKELHDIFKDKNVILDSGETEWFKFLDVDVEKLRSIIASRNLN